MLLLVTVVTQLFLFALLCIFCSGGQLRLRPSRDKAQLGSSTYSTGR